MWLLLGCFDPDLTFLDVPPEPAPPEPDGDAIPLARPGAPATFELPPSSRPGGLPAPERFGPIAPFREHQRRPKVVIWRTPLPIQPSLMPSASGGTHRFGSRPPEGMVVRGPEGELVFERGARSRGTWGFDEQWLYVATPPDAPAPEARDYAITFPRATETEDRLNLATSGLDAEAFARRTMTVGGESYVGLFLPAPATARFPLTVPERAVLSFDARLLDPAIETDARSDGATVVVEVHAEGRAEELRRVTVRPADPVPTVRVDLSAHAGRAVELVLRTEAGGDAMFDYVLVGAPTVYAAGGAPRRIVLVFVDTMRADHLGFMGYPRAISPTLDRLAANATVFEQARTVAPWTLPSARAALSGREPELWATSGTLAEALGAAGWRTDAVVSNAFLSQPFDVHRGWDRFSFEQLRRGRDVVALGLDALRDGADRDQLLLVHFMEPHLPYQEPWTYRHVWAGDRPRDLASLTRSWLSTELEPKHRATDEIREYVRDRYDQQILYVDHLLGPLLEAAGPDATIVVFSDHGEELWEHGGFEHGHAFWDEVLRVPLVIRSSALPPGRIAAPVSLLDLTPTLLDLAGLPAPDDLTGRSLIPLSRGEPGVAEAFAARPVAFGRPLYDGDGWGVMADGHKWWDRAGTQALFDLRGDPAEARDLSRRAVGLERWPERLSAALDRDVRRVWRLDLRLDTAPVDLSLAVSHPDGIADAWLGFDPRGRSSGVVPVITDGVVTLEVPMGTDPPRSVYLVPRGDPLEPSGLVATLLGGDAKVSGRSERPRLSTGPEPQQILAAGGDAFGLTVHLTWAPEPAGVAVPGFHPEMEAQLRELGYVDDAGG